MRIHGRVTWAWARDKEKIGAGEAFFQVAVWGRAFAVLTAADPDAMMGSVGAYEGNRGTETGFGSAYEEEKR